MGFLYQLVSDVVAAMIFRKMKTFVEYSWVIACEKLLTVMI